MTTTASSASIATATKPEGLIKLGGYMWNPELVFWGKQGPTNKGEMHGKHSGHKRRGAPGKAETSRRIVDYWDIHVVYALHYENELVYIGEGFLGDRIKAHYYDETDIGLWDRFTWLSPVDLVDDGTNAPSLTPWSGKKTFELESKGLVELLELVAITLAQPVGNSQQPTDESRIKWIEQVRHDKADRSLREQVSELKTMLEHIKGKLPTQ